jgi:ring-1,2-phenylacetyl-CoA epoxidase subunit PaaD
VVRERSPASPATSPSGVAEGRIWEALDELPDPEIPVISLVELGVVREVAVEEDRVRVALAPTFMGCPALDAMVRAIRERVEALGAACEVRVLLDDSWSTDDISPAGREKLRAAGLAPPAPRSSGPVTLVQLQRGPHRCPYCGSTETRLENLFGPTACRSLRYCTACRQPFEQFKTI